MKIEYPKFKKSDNRACKLNEDDLKEMWALKSMDLSLKEIGKHFGVSAQAIWYQIQSEEKKRELVKERHSRDTLNDKIKNNESSKKARKRKRITMLKEVREYHKIKSREFRKNHPEYGKLWLREFVKNNPDYMAEAQKRHRMLKPNTLF